MKILNIKFDEQGTKYSNSSNQVINSLRRIFNNLLSVHSFV